VDGGPRALLEGVEDERLRGRRGKTGPEGGGYVRGRESAVVDGDAAILAEPVSITGELVGKRQPEGRIPARHVARHLGRSDGLAVHVERAWPLASRE